MSYTSSDPDPKRRRLILNNPPMDSDMGRSPSDGGGNHSPQAQSPAHVPKRGARACTACRKGKNRCEGEVSFLFVVVVLGAAVASPSRSLCSLARHPRPGPALFLGSLSSLSTQRYSVYLRKTRQEKCSGIVWCKRRVRILICVFFPSSFINFKKATLQA
jgi:hypothetical protein